MEPDLFRITDYDALLGEVIARKRKFKGLEQEDFVEGLSISKSTLSRIERGETSATLPVMVELCNKLGLSLRDLVENIEDAALKLEENKVQVVPKADRKKDSNVAIAFLGGVALTLLIARLVAK